MCRGRPPRGASPNLSRKPRPGALGARNAGADYYEFSHNGGLESVTHGKTKKGTEWSKRERADTDLLSWAERVAARRNDTAPSVTPGRNDAAPYTTARRNEHRAVDTAGRIYTTDTPGRERIGKWARCQNCGGDYLVRAWNATTCQPDCRAQLNGFPDIEAAKRAANNRRRNSSGAA